MGLSPEELGRISTEQNIEQSYISDILNAQRRRTSSYSHGGRRNTGPSANIGTDDLLIGDLSDDEAHVTHSRMCNACCCIGTCTGLGLLALLLVVAPI